MGLLRIQPDITSRLLLLDLPAQNLGHHLSVSQLGDLDSFLTSLAFHDLLLLEPIELLFNVLILLPRADNVGFVII